LGELSEQEKDEWVSYIQNYQTDNGLFIDPLMPNVWWAGRHLTAHAVSALAALGAVAQRKIACLEPFKNQDFVAEWLEGMNWKGDPANVVHEVQNYGTLLQYARDFQNERWAEVAVTKMLDWLDETQDPQTGLWGNRFNTPTLLSEGVQTSYHFWLLYFYDRRPIKYAEKVVDSCLATQNKLGGFGVISNSSACEDIDSIDPLVRLSSIMQYRKSEIEVALSKALFWVLINMNEDGGFVFRRGEPFIYGHELMYSRADQSAMFPTWFRTLSLAYLGKVLSASLVGNYEWQFINCPGFQFWHDI
jgi:hypothetical protein